MNSGDILKYPKKHVTHNSLSRDFEAFQIPFIETKITFKVTTG